MIPRVYTLRLRQIRRSVGLSRLITTASKGLSGSTATAGWGLTPNRSRREPRLFTLQALQAAREVSARARREPSTATPSHS